MKEGKRTTHLHVGRLGEQIAVDFLTNLNYQLVDTNKRYTTGEIDIIVRKKDETLVFVEVKTRSVGNIDSVTEDDYCVPQEMINSNKIKKLRKAIHLYLTETNSTQLPWRLDAVIVLLDVSANKAKCRHYKYLNNNF